MTVSVPRAAIRGAVVQDGEARSADQLRSLAGEVEACLRSLPGAGRVVVATPDRGAFVAAVVGAWRAGHVPVPLAETAPRPASVECDQLRARLEETGPALVLADAQFGPFLAEAGYTRAATDGPGPFEGWCPPAGDETPNPPGCALIVFTSGSTGRPKAVVIPPAALDAIAATNRRVYRFDADDRFLSALPMTHLAGLTNLLAALDAGCDVVVAPPMLFVNEVLATVVRFRVSVIGTVPHQLDQLVGRRDTETPAGIEPGRVDGLATVRLVVSSGARLSPAVVESAARAMPDAELVNAYGLTEAFRSFAAPARVDDVDAIGAPLPGVEARLIDLDSGRPPEPGQPGEIQLRGANLFRGYRRPDGTVEPAPRVAADRRRGHDRGRRSVPTGRTPRLVPQHRRSQGGGRDDRSRPR